MDVNTRLMGLTAQQWREGGKRRSTIAPAPGGVRALVNGLIVVRVLLDADRPLSVLEVAERTPGAACAASKGRGATLPAHTVRRVLRALLAAGWPLDVTGENAQGARGGALRNLYALDVATLTAGRDRAKVTP